MTIEELQRILAPPAPDQASWCHFDHQWYLQAYPDLRAKIDGEDFAVVRQYYLDHGRALLHSPNMLFDERWYRRRYPDIEDAIAAGEIGSGYEHYCATGYQNRSPHWLYDDAVYGLFSPDLTDQTVAAAGCFNRYDHYVKSGAAELRVAHLLFDPATYRRFLETQDGAAAALATNPFANFLHRIWVTRRDATTSIFFDPAWYVAHHADARAALRQGDYVCALQHYLTGPDPAAHDPLPQFSEAFYREHNPDIVAAIRTGVVASGYDHFLRAGVFDLRNPSSDIDLRAYMNGNAAAQAAIAAGTCRNAFEYLLRNAPPVPARAPRPAPKPVAKPAVTVPLAAASVAVPSSPEEPSTWRPSYTGANTIGTLRDRVVLEIEETILCPPGGLVLSGWLLAAPGAIAAIRLHCGAEVVTLRPEHFVRGERADVAGGLGAELGLTEPRCGFLAYAPAAYAPGDASYIEVETTRGEIGFRGVPEPKLRGMPAIRYLLERFDVRYDEVVRCFDQVVGPAIASLNQARLREGAEREVIDFGAQPEAPDISVIVPLYGRLDFMEYQFALFSRHQPAIAREFIYVLDDPALRRPAEVLAASVYARFGLPFRLVLLSRNLGYAPANNAGLALARGDYVCLLNSDVMPDTDDWMERLMARLRDNPDIGAIGPLLLFEDRSVQHQGMAFEPLPEFGNWLFPMHRRKGRRPEPEGGLRGAAAITGACLVIPREVLQSLGGLDESYVIGDFEDSDLCMKLAGQGLGCAVDSDVMLFHLERQSQAGPEQRWRMNLTLYNAWVHEARWGEALRARVMPPPRTETGRTEGGPTERARAEAARRRKAAKTRLPA